VESTNPDVQFLQDIIDKSVQKSTTQLYVVMRELDTVKGFIEKEAAHRTKALDTVKGLIDEERVQRESLEVRLTETLGNLKASHTIEYIEYQPEAPANGEVPTEGQQKGGKMFTGSDRTEDVEASRLAKNRHEWLCVQLAELQAELRAAVASTTNVFNSISVDCRNGRVESIDLCDTQDKMPSDSTAVPIFQLVRELQSDVLQTRELNTQTSEHAWGRAEQLCGQANDRVDNFHKYCSTLHSQCEKQQHALDQSVSTLHSRIESVHSRIESVTSSVEVVLASQTMKDEFTFIRKLQNLEQELHSAHEEDHKRLESELSNWRQACDGERQKRDNEMKKWREALLLQGRSASQSRRVGSNPHSESQSRVSNSQSELPRGNIETMSDEGRGRGLPEAPINIVQMSPRPSIERERQQRVIRLQEQRMMEQRMEEQRMEEQRVERERQQQFMEEQEHQQRSKLKENCTSATLLALAQAERERQQRMEDQLKWQDALLSRWGSPHVAAMPSGGAMPLAAFSAMGDFAPAQQAPNNISFPERARSGSPLQRSATPLRIPAVEQVAARPRSPVRLPSSERVMEIDLSPNPATRLFSSDPSMSAYPPSELPRRSNREHSQGVKHSAGNTTPPAARYRDRSFARGQPRPSRGSAPLQRSVTAPSGHSDGPSRESGRVSVLTAAMGAGTSPHSARRAPNRLLSSRSPI